MQALDFDALDWEAEVDYTVFVLVFGCALYCLGAAIMYYLLRVFLESHSERKSRGKREPEYVREINRRLKFNKVETERDLL